MKKNIVMTITRIDKNQLNNEKDNFIKPEIYETIKKEFDYSNEVKIKDLNFILNIILVTIQKYKLLLIFLILLIFFLLIYLKR